MTNKTTRNKIKTQKKLKIKHIAMLKSCLATSVTEAVDDGTLGGIMQRVETEFQQQARNVATRNLRYVGDLVNELKFLHAIGGYTNYIDQAEKEEDELDLKLSNSNTV